MASRVDRAGTNRAPGFGRVVRAALSDFYFNSGRLVAANVIWGVAAVGVWLVWLVSPLLALLLAPLLAFPTVGIFRLAARIVRGDGPTSVRDALAAFRDYAGSTVLLGLATVAAVLIFATNAIVGLSQSEPLGWSSARWRRGAWSSSGAPRSWSGRWWSTRHGLATRCDEPSARRPAAPCPPGRLALLGILVAIITLVSTILLAALLTISVSFIALVACRYVYPTADAFEARLVGEP